MKNRNKNKKLNVSIDEMIEAIVERDMKWFEFDTASLEEMLACGWKGWANYPDEDIKEEYERILEDSLV